MFNLDAEVRRAAKAVRERMTAADLSYFTMEIEVSGRVQEGDVKISYGLAASQYGTKVQGGDLTKVVTEVLRRHGWEEANQPLMLEAPRTPANDELIESPPTPQSSDADLVF